MTIRDSASWLKQIGDDVLVIKGPSKGLTGRIIEKSHRLYGIKKEYKKTLFLVFINEDVQRWFDTAHLQKLIKKNNEYDDLVEMKQFLSLNKRDFA